MTSHLGPPTLSPDEGDPVVPSRLWALSNDLLAVTEPFGRFVAANDRWHDAVGIRPSELASLGLFDIMHPSDRRKARQHERSLADPDTGPISFEGRFVRTDGSDVHLRCQIEADHDERLWYVAATDMTEHRAVEVERRFLSMLTHELQTPLMAIKGFVGLLLHRDAGIDGSQHREFLTHIDSSADRMQRLVQEFLRLARHHAEGVEARRERFELAPLVDAAVDELSAALADIDVRVPPGLVVQADVQFTTQILTNLLTNAQRYGTAPIEIAAEQLGDSVVLSVRDHGTGVSEKFRPHLFKRFSRADRTGEGTGLGLSICRELAVAQGGSLIYEPADPGARFTVRFLTP